MATELPPAYSTLSNPDTTNHETEEPVPSSENDSEIFGAPFETKDSRIGFIQKVLAIKLLQVMIVSVILVAVIFFAGGFFHHTVMDFDGYFRINCLFISTLAFATTIWSLRFCKKARNLVPYNYMFLVAYPVTFALFMIVVLYGYGIKSFMLSWLHFNGVVFGLLLYSILALQTDIEFKANVGLYIAAGILVVAYPLTVPITDLINPFKVFYFSLMMFLGTAYILYDIEAMTSKDYHIPLTPADFVKAAVLMHAHYRFLFMKIYNELKERQTENSARDERVKLMSEVNEAGENEED